MPDSKTQELLKLARKGPIRARDVESHGIPRTYLERLRKRGLLEKVDRGLYRLADSDLTELSSIADVASRVPQATICLLSALQLHELTVELPHAVWILIDHKSWRPTFAYPALEIVHASGRALEYGVEQLDVEGVSVKVTSPSKTVADCFKYRNRVGLDVAIEALRDYVRTRRQGLQELVDAAKVDRVYTVMRPYMEALT